MPSSPSMLQCISELILARGSQDVIADMQSGQWLVCSQGSTEVLTSSRCLAAPMQPTQCKDKSPVTSFILTVVASKCLALNNWINNPRPEAQGDSFTATIFLRTRQLLLGSPQPSPASHGFNEGQQEWYWGIWVVLPLWQDSKDLTMYVITSLRLLRLSTAGLAKGPIPLWTTFWGPQTSGGQG